MAEFADRMTSFTDHLRASIQARNEARKQIHASTEELTERTQAFMAHVADEHRARADDLRETLAAHRDERLEKAEELRNHHHESLQKMRGDLNHLLSETRKTRQDAVDRLFDSFQHARTELALDLREASMAWQVFAAGRSGSVAPVVKSRGERPHKQPAAVVAVAEKAARKEPVAHAKPQSKPRRGK